MASHREQIAGMVYMVRPANFTANKATLGDNFFQDPDGVSGDPQAKALREFDAFVSLLRENGILVAVAQDTEEPHTPDSIFPNNWFVTNSDGTLSIFRLFAKNRDMESRKPELYDKLLEVYRPVKILDLRPIALETGAYLEGTGSMILDRYNDVAYACRSKRTDEGLFHYFCQERNYEPILFDAVDTDGNPIYHTNVMMTVVEDLAVICADSIPNETEREEVLKKLTDTGHEIVLLSLDQLYAYAGNMLGVKNLLGQRFMVMSRQALLSLTPTQVAQISRKMGIIAPDIKTIETLGGGSARCMMAEIFKHKELNTDYFGAQ